MNALHLYIKVSGVSVADALFLRLYFRFIFMEYCQNYPFGQCFPKLANVNLFTK